MAGRTTTRYELRCDGCEKPFGDKGEYATAIEARGAAYADGWRFPAKERMNNKGPSQAHVSDVCPDCVPTFKPQMAPDTWKRRRNA